MQQDELRKLVDSVHATLFDQTLYELLGVARDADDKAIKDAFRKRARTFHVDNHPELTDAELRGKLVQIFGEVSRAHSTLTNKDQREEYDAMLSLTERGVPTDLKVIFDADKSFQLGKRLVERGEYQKAMGPLSQAATANPSENVYRAYRAWCVFCIASENGDAPSGAEIDRVLMELESIAEDDKHVDMADVFLGNVARVLGDTEGARAWYESALSKNKNNLEAVSQLRLLNMRSSKKQSWWQRLFKKS